MQMPPVDRTVNGPSFGSVSQPAAGGMGTAPRATRVETNVIQKAAAQSPAPEPAPSVKLELSAEIDELIKIEKARDKDTPKNAATPVPSGADAELRKLSGQQPDPADASAQPGQAGQAGKVPGVSGADAPQAVAKYAATGQAPGPDQPSSTAEAAPKDWTAKPKVEEKKPAEPPKEPISKKLLEFLQSLWRAGGNAIDVAQNTNDVLNKPKEADGPLTYSDPSARKTTGV